jgi:hypothetical protein
MEYTGCMQMTSPPTDMCRSVARNVDARHSGTLLKPAVLACGRWIFSDTVTFIGQCDKTEQMLSPGDGWYHRIGSNAHDRELVCRGAWTLVTVEVFATCQVREAQVSSIFDRWPTSVPKSMTSSMRANRC